MINRITDQDDQPEGNLETPEPPSDAPRKRRRMLRLAAVPTAFTLGNLVCGVLAISYVADSFALAAGDGAAGLAAAGEKIASAGWLLLLGMVFDALDGRVARMTRTTTEFGGALDSLADLVSFGVAPALVMKAVIQIPFASPSVRLAFLSTAFFAVCAALRLARYNAEEENADDAVSTFVGLPTPGAAGLLAGFAITHAQILSWWEPSAGALHLGAHMLGLGVLSGLGLLMVSRVPYAHFGNRFFHGRKTVGWVAIVALLIMLFAYVDDVGLILFGGFCLYALSGPLAVLPRLFSGRRHEVTELFE